MTTMITLNALLQNRYRIVCLIGRGGQGAVYEAIDERLGCKVALKENFQKGEQVSRAFEREARLLAKLFHPALPKVSDQFNEADSQFLVMEYVSGDNLAEIIERKSVVFSVDDVLTWADQLLEAIDYLHTQETPIIHRDIAPKNLKLTDRGQIVLLDFGLAKDESGSIIWGYSKHFAPLEQIKDSSTDQRSDIYSVAATLYNLLTGILAPDAEARHEAIKAGHPDPLCSASELNLQIKPDVAAVLMQAMAQDKNERFPTAAAMRAALRETTFLTDYKRREASPTLLRTYSLFGYETDGGRESVLWNDPMGFNQLIGERGDDFYQRYNAWVRRKRRFTFDEIVDGRWVKIGDHRHQFHIKFLSDGTVNESLFFNFNENDYWNGTWKLVDGILRLNFKSDCSYELDIVASRNGVHAGVEDANEQRNAYYRLIHVR